jgi:hypothetical protein
MHTSEFFECFSKPPDWATNFEPVLRIRIRIFFDPLDPGSGMEKIQIKDPK